MDKTESFYIFRVLSVNIKYFVCDTMIPSGHLHLNKYCGMFHLKSISWPRAFGKYCLFYSLLTHPQQIQTYEKQRNEEIVQERNPYDIA